MDHDEPKKNESCPGYGHTLSYGKDGMREQSEIACCPDFTGSGSTCESQKNTQIQVLQTLGPWEKGVPACITSAVGKIWRPQNPKISKRHNSGFSGVDLLLLEPQISLEKIEIENSEIKHFLLTS